MKLWKEYTRKELFSLPKREWGRISEYEAILIVNTLRKHRSGYNWIAVIGCKDGSHPTEIAAIMDVLKIETDLPFTIDMSPHGVVRFHSLGRYRGITRFFQVGESLETTTVSSGNIVNDER